MPITKAAKKALRQSKKRRLKNLQNKQSIRKLLKEIVTLTGRKKTEEAKKLLPQVYKILDKAAKTGLIKKNAAARKKSRLTKLIQKSAN